MDGTKTHSRRALLTFATVSEALEQSNDFLLGIAPLFAAIAEESAGAIFQADKFAREVKTKFGLSIPEEVASFLAPRLVKSGLLETRNIGSDEKALFWAPRHSLPPADTNIDAKLDEIISQFGVFVESSPSQTKRESMNVKDELIQVAAVPEHL